MKQVTSIDGPVQNGAYSSYVLNTRRGPIDIHLYDAANPAAVLMVGGVGGGFDTPAKGLYPSLAEALGNERVAALRVKFRNPVDLGEAVYDVLCGLEYLNGQGKERVILIGHSFGGAVVIQAGLRSDNVEGVVALSTQSFGTNGVEKLAPKPILLMHGEQDEILPAYCSIDVHRRASPPKALRLLPGAWHGLDEAADEVFSTVRDWITDTLLPGRMTANFRS